MDSATQREIGTRLIEARRDRGVIWTLQKAAWAEFFDRVLVMRAGRLVEQGTFKEIIGQAVSEVLDSLDLRRIVLAVGLDYQVGVGGRRLTAVQRQKLAIARALLKEPDLLIINEAAAVMDSATQRQIGSRLLEARRGRGVIWTLQRAAWAEFFDRVLVMRAGRLIEQGTFEELNAPGPTLGELVAAG